MCAQVNNITFPTWAIAARIIFAMLPSSAPCERVFSMVEGMFDKDQLSVLATCCRHMYCTC